MSFGNKTTTLTLSGRYFKIVVYFIMHKHLIDYDRQTFCFTKTCQLLLTINTRKDQLIQHYFCQSQKMAAHSLSGILK